MKTKYPSMFGILVALMLIVSFVIPANLVSPSAVEADPGICKWDTVYTPGSLPLKGDLQNNSDILDMAVGGDAGTIVWIIRERIPTLPGIPPVLWATNQNMVISSVNMGVNVSSTPFYNLFRAATNQIAWVGGEQLYQVAVAPDNPKFWAVTADAAGAGGVGPVDVWVTPDGGSSWQWAGNIPFPVGNAEFIRAIDVSVNVGGGRDIAIATEDARFANNNSSNIYVVKSVGFGTWQAQLPARVGGEPWIDFQDIKFSPTYNADASLTVVFSDNAATFFNIAFRDLATNTTLLWQWAGGPLGLRPSNGIEVRNPSGANDESAGTTLLNKAIIALPSDFNGQAASLRRAYVSTDAWNAGGTKTGLDVAGPGGNLNAFDGIFRIDDTIQYMLMDTSQTFTKSIYSIAYFGTYASGKLLAGERMGYPCTATVPTWFTDSPTTCPIPCWYPALKPTTGAAAVAGCDNTQTGPGGAIVGWKADGSLAYVSTGSLLEQDTPTGWFANWLIAMVANDESAFAISRNNGETWNQLTFIDTVITQLVDVAPTPDCKTVYLATVNAPTGVAAVCTEFDSVWRSSVNNEVAAPLPALPIGIIWERIMTRVTAPDCTFAQTDAALLRIVPYCADPSGQIVAWAVYDTAAVYTTGVAMWSPDYGDYWASVGPRFPVQDFCFESATVMYFLAASTGLVQKMPYTGTAWSNTLGSVSPVLPNMHTIAAYPEGRVLVGSGGITSANLYAASYSSNMNTDSPSFAVLSLAGQTAARGNIHVAFDPDFENNNTVFIADGDQVTGAGLGGSVYRNAASGNQRWADTNMMSAMCGATGSLAPHEVGQYGIVLAFTGADGQTALYSAHNVSNVVGNVTLHSGVCRTLWPLDGMPKPGIVWDCLDAGIANGVVFTREPSSLKACGCCTMDTDTTLYTLDNRAYVPVAATGMLWAFTDCVAKKGPALITEDKSLIGCDPVSGRAQEVNLCWEQLCVADTYDIEIAKLDNFSIRVIDWVVRGTVPPGALGPGAVAWPILFLAPADVMTPCVYFPAGGATQLGTGAMSQIAAWGNLECGHTYYWRVQVRSCATAQVVRSPWSEIRSFTVKAGLPVTTPYYGPQLLAPNNGCLGCPVAPASFSWSPFKETTKYKFVLASDAAMTQIVKEAEVATTAFEYDGTLEYSTNYFWRIMAMEPAPSDWSATFSFQTGTPSTPSVSQVPSKAGFWGALAVPAKAISAWAASLNIQPISPMRPLLPWAWVAILICVILFVLWLVVMIAISRLNKPHKKDQM